MSKPFQNLSDPIKADPARAVRIAEHKAALERVSRWSSIKTLAEIRAARPDVSEQAIAAEREHLAAGGSEQRAGEAEDTRLSGLAPTRSGSAGPRGPPAGGALIRSLCSWRVLVGAVRRVERG